MNGIFELLENMGLSQSQIDTISKAVANDQKFILGETAHTLNNLLTVILGNLELAQESSQNPNVTLDSLFMDLEDPLNRLKSFARKNSLSTGKTGFTRGTVNLHDVINKYFDSDDFTEDSVRHRGDFLKKYSSDSLFIDGAIDLIYDAVRNTALVSFELSSNHGTIEYATRVENDFIYLETKIYDFQAPLDKYQIASFFAPYFLSRALHFGGIGLEASTVKGIADSLGGSVYVKNEDVFTFGSRYPSIIPLEKANGTSSKGNLVLIVDDELALRKLSSAVLSNNDYDVREAESGEEAIRLFQEGLRPDLILLDMNLGRGKNGLETYAEISEMVPDQHVLICSGYSDQQQEISERPGIKGFIAKPFSNKQLVDTVQNILGR